MIICWTPCVQASCLHAVVLHQRYREPINRNSAKLLGSTDQCKPLYMSLHIFVSLRLFCTSYSFCAHVCKAATAQFCNLHVHKHWRRCGKSIQALKSANDLKQPHMHNCCWNGYWLASLQGKRGSCLAPCKQVLLFKEGFFCQSTGALFRARHETTLLSGISAARIGCVMCYTLATGSITTFLAPCPHRCTPAFTWLLGLHVHM